MLGEPETAYYLHHALAFGCPTLCACSAQTKRANRPTSAQRSTFAQFAAASEGSENKVEQGHRPTLVQYRAAHDPDRDRDGGLVSGRFAGRAPPVDSASGSATAVPFASTAFHRSRRNAW